MIEEHENYIICVRQEDAKTENIADGSKTTNCCECDKPLWISPASIAMMLDHNAKPVCLQCAAASGSPPRDIKPPTAEQLKEVMKKLKNEN